MLHRQLVTSCGDTLHIHSNDPRIVGHWSDRSNHADTILAQINHEKLYDNIFRGRKYLNVLDLGANIGLFSLYVSASARIVISVEPTPAHFYILNHLTKNIDNILAINAAVNPKNQDIEFFINDENSTMNSLINRTGRSLTVRGMTIPHILEVARTSHIDVCKVDIEGSEVLAITDETVSEVKGRVDSWYLELHSTPDCSIETAADLFSRLFARHGYKSQRLNTDTIFATVPDYGTVTHLGRY